MNEARFIELLNLYVDQQLSPSEARELETEIVRNTDRRRTYHQYCRMQKACTLMFEQERTHAPASKKLAAALEAADRKIIAFPESGGRSRNGYLPWGLVAAAACVAFVFVRSGQFGSDQKTDGQASSVAVVQPASSPAQPVILAAASTSAPAVAVTSPATPSTTGFFSVLGIRRPANTGTNVQIEFIEDAANASSVSYSWMNDVELAPVPALSPSSLSLRLSSVAPEEDRVIRSRKPVQGATEMTAFQFQR